MPELRTRNYKATLRVREVQHGRRSLSTLDARIVVQYVCDPFSSVSSQVGRNPNVLVWSSSAECSKGGAVLNKKKAVIATLKGHGRKVGQPTRLYSLDILVHTYI